MKIEYVQGKAKSERADLLVLPVLQEKKGIVPQIQEIDEALKGLLSRRSAQEEFSGKMHQTLAADAGSAIGSPRLLLYGLGKPQDFQPESFRRAVAKAVAIGEHGRAVRVSILLPQNTGVSDAALVRAGAEGAVLGSYRYTKFKSDSHRAEIKALSLVGPVKKTPEIDAALELGVVGAEATNFTRDLVNEPAGTQPPSELSRVAKSLAGKTVQVNVFTGKELEKLGARAILAVSAGSLEPPQLIEMIYKPATKAKGKRRRIAVVGKGLTFDSGGLSLKTADGMMTMKCDMAGAAAVLGLFRALPKVAPDVEVVGIIGATENMPGARAQKPGDVIRTMSGKTIEVLNTDAEGRLVLADALHYARIKHKPDAVIDLATLTGAVVVGLGDWYAGAMGNDQGLLDEVLAAAKRAEEKMWPLPLDEDMRSKMDSDIADIKNISGDRWGGSITAGLFLREFVGDSPWVHLDIAGPAFAEKTPALGPKGGTGYAVRTLLELVRTPPKS